MSWPERVMVGLLVWIGLAIIIGPLAGAWMRRSRRAQFGRDDD